MLDFPSNYFGGTVQTILLSLSRLKQLPKMLTFYSIPVQGLPM